MDKPGLLLVVLVTVASADDGTIAPEVLGRLTAEHQARLRNISADGKYRNNHLAEWLVRTEAGYVVEVVSRPLGGVGFVKQPQRYVVERTFAWLGRYRRHSRDCERFTESSAAMVRISSIHRMLVRLKPDNSMKPVPFKYRELQEKVYRIASTREEAKFHHLERGIASQHAPANLVHEHPSCHDKQHGITQGSPSKGSPRKGSNTQAR